jgi:hypothetical protein
LPILMDIAPGGSRYRSTTTREQGEPMTDCPCITIVGSADEGGAYDPPLSQVEACRDAAREIGRELARQGCHLVVYTGDPEYIEYHVVEGYVNTKAKGKKRVTLRFVEGGPKAFFPDDWHKSGCIETEADNDLDWEVNFFRSMPAADGVILLGGRRFGFLAGLVVLSQHLPLVPVATLGGAAQRVWQKLDPNRDGTLVTDIEIKQMREPKWTDRSAEKVVSQLLIQRRRARELQSRAETADAERLSRREVARLAMPLLYVAVAIAALVVGLVWIKPGASALPYFAALIIPPALAGLAGAACRGLRDSTTIAQRAANTVIGCLTGVAASLLFIASQLTTNDALLSASAKEGADQGRRLLLFSWIVGLVAGITFDVVFEKIRGSDVARTNVLDLNFDSSQQSSVTQRPKV